MNDSVIAPNIDHDVMITTGFASDDIYTISASDTCLPIGPSTVITNGGVGSMLGTGLYTTTSSNITNGNWPQSWTQPAPKLTLNGQDADIEINGVSLTETLKGLQDRLNILRPNADLESRWEQLRDLRQQYQRLEAELLEKERAWAMLQNTK